MLSDILRKQIKASGFMPVDAFIDYALFHPTYGYYVTDAPTFGREGDFVTAPEISSLFGETLAEWCFRRWESMGRPKKWRLIECGPGSGACMHALYDAISLREDMESGVSVTLIEASPALRRMQCERLSHVKALSHEDDVRFLKSNDVPFVIFGNEFFDALPIRQFVHENGKLYERGVGLMNDEFVFVRRQNPLPISAEALRARFGELPDGAIIEENALQERFLRSVADAMRHNAGAALFIDYGYFQPPYLSTLQAVCNHKKTHVFEDIGEADVSSLVNFAAAAAVPFPSCAQEAVTETQGAFLLRHGILELAATRRDKEDAARRVARLTHPDHMGDLFKAISWQGFAQ